MRGELFNVLTIFHPTK